MQCTLCESKTLLFETYKSKKYFKCPTCLSILLSKENYLDLENEKNRYDQHSDDIESEGYVNFVSPIVKAVEHDFSSSQKGLDFGCGNSAIIQKLVQKEGFDIKGFDPFYFPNNELLQKTYNYITCCEVVEHFYSPQKEFKLLSSMLKEGGKLYVKTNLFSEQIDFSKWWYKNDATHVFFYSKETMEFIQFNFGFKSVKFLPNHIEFSK